MVEFIVNCMRWREEFWQTFFSSAREKARERWIGKRYSKDISGKALVKLQRLSRKKCVNARVVTHLRIHMVNPVRSTQMLDSQVLQGVSLYTFHSKTSHNLFHNLTASCSHLNVSFCILLHSHHFAQFQPLMPFLSISTKRKILVEKISTSSIKFQPTKLDLEKKHRVRIVKNLSVMCYGWISHFNNSHASKVKVENQ